MKHILYILAAISALSGCANMQNASSVTEDDSEINPENYVSDGYTTQRKDQSSRSTARIVPNENEISNYTNILDYLTGRVPGLYIERGKVHIRGNKEEPLFIVDGSEVMDISSLNPNDVRSVDVLKGPEANIYGSRGINGVIVIKTKGAGDDLRGKDRKKSATVSVSSGVTIN